MLNFKESRSFFPGFLYAVLLVIYFMVHETNDNYGLIPTWYIFQQTLVYGAITLIISLLAWYLYKSTAKAFLFTLLIISILLFFGAFHDSVKKWPVPVFFTRYTFILGFLLFVVIAAMVFIKRTRRPLIQLSRYSLITLIILCVWETTTLAFHMFSGKQEHNILFSPNDRDTTILNSAGTTTLPNIYFIVFDGFTSSKCLKEQFGFDNAPLDSFLQQLGFYIVRNSKSNYQITPLSIGSTLNFSYLVPEIDTLVSPQDLVKAHLTVSHNRLVPFLEKKGYAIYNHSVFNLPRHPSTGAVFFDYLEKGLLTQQTLWGRFNRDLGWNFANRNFITGKRVEKKANETGLSAYMKNYVTGNTDALQRSVKHKSGSPKFIYCHSMLPHEPFLFLRDGSLMYEPIRRNLTLKQQYIEQLIYTRNMVTSTIQSIFEHDQGRKIIIVEGDHGFRDFGWPQNAALYFDNLNAIYFYDKNYTALHDSISPVNTFRVVLNQYFGQRLPYLQDSCVYVH